MGAIELGATHAVACRPMSNWVSAGQEAFLANLPLIDEVIRITARRYQCRREEAEEFTSLAMLKLISDDYAVLRKFAGRSSLRTYLHSVVRHLFLDFRARHRGKWRPSARARRLGEVAVRLEMLLQREKRSFDEACQILRVNECATESESELARIAAYLPTRRLRWVESGGPFQEPAVPTEVADRFAHAGDRRQQQRVQNVLQDGLRRLTPEERLLLRLRFLEGMKPQQIARALGLKAPSLYRRIEQSLDRLRRRLRREGLQAGEVSDALEAQGFDLTAALWETSDVESPCPSESV
jgi:RNA polymerase sigma factor (sigma-70 family)